MTHNGVYLLQKKLNLKLKYLRVKWLYINKILTLNIDSNYYKPAIGCLHRQWGE